MAGRGRGWLVLAWVMLVAGAGFVLAGVVIGSAKAVSGITMLELYFVARLLAGGGLLFWGGHRLRAKNRRLRADPAQRQR